MRPSSRLKSWRERAAPIIERVLRETKGFPEQVIKKHLRDAYPFGERRYWPYKVWCDEVKRQRGFKEVRGRIIDHPNQEMFNFEGD